MRIFYSTKAPTVPLTQVPRYRPLPQVRPSVAEQPTPVNSDGSVSSRWRFVPASVSIPGKSPVTFADPATAYSNALEEHQVILDFHPNHAGWIAPDGSVSLGTFPKANPYLAVNRIKSSTEDTLRIIRSAVERREHGFSHDRVMVLTDFESTVTYSQAKLGFSPGARSLPVGCDAGLLIAEAATPYLSISPEIEPAVRSLWSNSIHAEIGAAIGWGEEVVSTANGSVRLGSVNYEHFLRSNPVSPEDFPRYTTTWGMHSGRRSGEGRFQVSSTPEQLGQFNSGYPFYGHRLSKAPAGPWGVFLQQMWIFQSILAASSRASFGTAPAGCLVPWITADYVPPAEKIGSAWVLSYSSFYREMVLHLAVACNDFVYWRNSSWPDRSLFVEGVLREADQALGDRPDRFCSLTADGVPCSTFPSLGPSIEFLANNCLEISAFTTIGPSGRGRRTRRDGSGSWV